MLSSSVLVLNRSYLPIHITSVRRSFSLVYGGGAHVVNERYETFDFDSWKQRAVKPGEDYIGTVDGLLPVPRVIALHVFDRVPRRHIRLSRSNVFSRDGYTCQYCGVRPPRSELNLDHVIPRIQKGRTTWENVVCCCIDCNRRKGGRTPDEAGLKLSRKPTRPRWSPLMTLPTSSVRYREWRPFLAIGEDRLGMIDVAV